MGRRSAASSVIAMDDWVPSFTIAGMEPVLVAGCIGLDGDASDVVRAALRRARVGGASGCSARLLQRGVGIVLPVLSGAAEERGCRSGACGELNPLKLPVTSEPELRRSLSCEDRGESMGILLLQAQLAKFAGVRQRQEGEPE